MIKNLDEAVSKRNGSDGIVLTRRAALLGLSISIVGSSVSQVRSEPLPTRDDMEDYFLFLWCEHNRVADELGIDPFHSVTAYRRGGNERYQHACPEPAASRALRVLTEAGMRGADA